MNILFLSHICEFNYKFLEKEHQVKKYFEDFEGVSIEEIIENYDIIVVRHKDRIDKSIISKAKNLKMIISCDVETDNIDIEFAEQNNIDVMYIPEAHIISVAELTIGLILDIVRNISFYNQKYKKEFNLSKNIFGMELSNKTLGIIGFGKVGREVAKRALSFGMRVIACDKYLNKSLLNEVKLVSKDEILIESDIITLHIPLNNENKLILGKDEFDKIKKGAIIINSSRSGLIDMDILIEKLKNGCIGGVAIDSVESKKYVDILNSLQSCEHKIVLTPHIGALTLEAEKKIGEYVIKVIQGFIHK